MNKIWGNKDDELKQQFILQLQTQLGELDLMKGQLKVDENEAASSNLFVSGWRPCVGWVCALAFSWTYFLQPIVTYIIITSGHPSPQLPALDMGQMMSLLTGMLGMAGLRTYEKVSKNNQQSQTSRKT